MFATRFLRQAAQHAERTPMIQFVGRRTIPSSIDHSARPHPASPTNSLPANWAEPPKPSHSSFSQYRQSTQQYGPLRRSIYTANGEPGIGGRSAHELGSIHPGAGEYFDRSDLPTRFHRNPLTMAEIEAVESGGAAAFA